MSAPASSSSKAKAKAKATRKPRKSSTKAAATATNKAAGKTVVPAQPVEVKADPTAAPQTPAVVTDEQIGERAYQIWIEKGRPYGQEQANWDQAVAELRG